MNTQSQNVPNSVLVTGASTGFGRETSFHLAERGFRVYASLRDLWGQADLDMAAADRKLSLRVVRLDVTDYTSVNRPYIRLLKIRVESTA